MHCQWHNIILVMLVMSSLMLTKHKWRAVSPTEPLSLIFQQISLYSRLITGNTSKETSVDSILNIYDSIMWDNNTSVLLPTKSIEQIGYSAVKSVPLCRCPVWLVLVFFLSRRINIFGQKYFVAELALLVPQSNQLWDWHLFALTTIVQKRFHHFIDLIVHLSIQYSINSIVIERLSKSTMGQSWGTW